MLMDLVMCVLCVQASTARKKKDLRPSDARRLAAKMGRSTEWLLFSLNVVNVLCTLLVPSAVVELTHAEPVPGFFVVVCTVILWMKLVSYAHCNYDLRCGVSPSLKSSLALRADILLHQAEVLVLSSLSSL